MAQHCIDFIPFKVTVSVWVIILKVILPLFMYLCMVGIAAPGGRGSEERRALSSAAEEAQKFPFISKQEHQAGNPSICLFPPLNRAFLVSGTTGKWFFLGAVKLAACLLPSCRALIAKMSLTLLLDLLSFPYIQRCKGLFNAN